MELLKRIIGFVLLVFIERSPKTVFVWADDTHRSLFWALREDTTLARSYYGPSYFTHQYCRESYVDANVLLWTARVFVAHRYLWAHVSTEKAVPQTINNQVVFI